MGRVQGKSSNYSPPQSYLEKMKEENGYVERGNYEGPRRSTGKVGNVNLVRHVGVENQNVGVVNGSNGSGKKVVHREGEIVRNNDGANGNVSQRKVLKESSGDYELVDGWPKWLVDNIPREVLTGLVPKSADSYDKLANVMKNQEAVNLIDLIRHLEDPQEADEWLTKEALSRMSKSTISCVCYPL